MKSLNLPAFFNSDEDAVFHLRNHFYQASFCFWHEKAETINMPSDVFVRLLVCNQDKYNSVLIEASFKDLWRDFCMFAESEEDSMEFIPSEDIEYVKSREIALELGVINEAGQILNMEGKPIWNEVNI